jgi:hypothetical protein
LKLYSGKVVNRKRASPDEVIQTTEPISGRWHFEDAARMQTEADEPGKQG